MVLDLVGGAAPFWLEHGPQPSTMLYVLVLVVITAAIAGILPALHATRRRGGADLRQLGGSTGPRLGRMWSALIVAQVAFAVAVLPAAIKMGINEIRSSLTRPNYPVEEFVGAAVLTEIGSSAFGNRLLELRRRLQAEPDVAGVTFTGSLPQRNITGRIEVEGIPVDGASATNGSRGLTTFGIDTEYLDVYGLRVVAGRPFNALDASATNGPVIVDRSFAQRFLNGTSAVGRRMRYAATAERTTVALVRDRRRCRESAAEPDRPRHRRSNRALSRRTRATGGCEPDGATARIGGIPDERRLRPEGAPDPRRR